MARDLTGPVGTATCTFPGRPAQDLKASCGIENLRRTLGGLPERPRIVTSGSFSTLLQLLGEVDRLLPTY